MTDDDNDPTTLEQALRAPGTPAELGAEESYRAMFREVRREAALPVAPAVPPRTGRTTVRRLGTSSTLAVVFAVAGGGVAAAAYSTNLPDPVQRAVHSVLAPLGVPQAESQRLVDRAPERRAPETAPDHARTPTAPGSAEPTSNPSAPPSASESVTPDASRPSVTPQTPAVPQSTPSSAPSDSPVSTPPSPVSSPAATAPPRPKPADVSIGSAGATHQVAPGSTTVITGQVTAADGTPVADRQVVLQQRGPGGWRRIAVARTAADGSVSVSTGAAQRTTTYRLRAGKVRSATWRLVVQPTLTATARTAGRSAVVTATASGGQPGDQVRLLTRRNGTLVQEGWAALDSGGQARFEIAAPKRDRVYVVQLPATRAHAGTRVQVWVSRAVKKQAAIDESGPPDQS